MSDEERTEICEFLADHSVTDILNIWLEENCYGEIVDHLVGHINNRLSRLEKIEEIMRKE